MKSSVKAVKRFAIGTVAPSVIWLAAGCASAHPNVASPYQVGARTDAPPVLAPAPITGSLSSGESSPAGGPPALAPAQPSIVGMPSTRVNVSANGEDISQVITRMARQVGLSAVIDPSVKGPVTRSLQNMTLNDAMLNLVGSQYQYQVRNGALVVTPVQLVQRIYTVDYLQMSRVSSASTVVSRGTQAGSNGQSMFGGQPGVGGGVGSSLGGVAATGSDVIQSSSNVDIWGELTQQLEGILFGNTTDSTRNNAALNNGALGGSRPYSRCVGGTCLGISPITSLVNVTATPEKQEEVSRYLGLYNAAISRQVSIKAQVVEVTLDRSNSYGIDWSVVFAAAKRNARGTVSTDPVNLFQTDSASSVSGNATFNLGFGDFTLKAVLSALQSTGDVNVVATPSTNAMNQQKASFHVTREQQFFSVVRTPIITPNGVTAFSETPNIQTATVGLIFDVLPQISDKNVVMMAIRPSVTSLVSSQTITGANGVQAVLPVIDHRETDTMARVRSGETIMIGGLIQKQTTNDTHGVPILMHLPVLGKLFSHTTLTEHHSELVIFLTPEIVSGQPPGGR